MSVHKASEAKTSISHATINNTPNTSTFEVSHQYPLLMFLQPLLHLATISNTNQRDLALLWPWWTTLILVICPLRAILYSRTCSLCHLDEAFYNQVLAAACDIFDKNVCILVLQQDVPSQSQLQHCRKAWETHCSDHPDENHLWGGRGDGGM